MNNITYSFTNSSILTSQWMKIECWQKSIPIHSRESTTNHYMLMIFITFPCRRLLLLTILSTIFSFNLLSFFNNLHYSHPYTKYSFYIIKKRQLHISRQLLCPKTISKNGYSPFLHSIRPWPGRWFQIRAHLNRVTMWRWKSYRIIASLF